MLQASPNALSSEQAERLREFFAANKQQAFPLEGLFVIAVLAILVFLFFLHRHRFKVSLAEAREWDAEQAALSERKRELALKELANREIEADHKARILNTRDSAYLAEKRREEEEQRHLEELQAIKARLSRKG